MKERYNSLGERIATRIIDWIGTTSSLLLHSIVFLIFMILIISGYQTQTVMLVLTTGLSIEAIYLAIFIQISLNKNNKILEEVCEEVVELKEEENDVISDLPNKELI